MDILKSGFEQTKRIYVKFQSHPSIEGSNGQWVIERFWPKTATGYW